MIKNEIKEFDANTGRNNIPASSPKVNKVSTPFYQSVRKRCGGCGQVLVDDNCPDCNKVVVL